MICAMRITMTTEEINVMQGVSRSVDKQKMKPVTDKFCACSRPAVAWSMGEPVCAFCQQIERRLVMEGLLKQSTDLRAFNPTERERRLQAERYEEDRWSDTHPKPEPVKKPPGVLWLVQGFGNYFLGRAA